MSTLARYLEIYYIMDCLFRILLVKIQSLKQILVNVLCIQTTHNQIKILFRDSLEILILNKHLKLNNGKFGTSYINNEPEELYSSNGQLI